MTTANIVRPICTENFTSLPNFLFDFNRHFENLKPRDSAVLNYLLTKPATWKLRAQDIANAINLCVRTVYKALEKLQELGIARYERRSSGVTDWFICVHKMPQHPVNSAYSKKSHGKKSHGKTCHVLTKNEESLVKTEQSLTKKEKTTDDFVRYSEIEVDIAEFNPQQKIIAQKSLAKVPVATQLIILMMLKVALSKGGVKSPLAYLNALINKSIEGELDINRIAELQKQTAKPLSREEVIRQLFARHGEQIKLDLSKADSILIKGIGVISKFEFEKLGLIEIATRTSEPQAKANFFKTAKDLF
jgi:Fe2+ or Zn2+ uptake regulation protein